MAIGRFREVKVQRKSRKVLDGLKKHGESGTVLDGLLGPGRVRKGLKVEVPGESRKAWRLEGTRRF